MEVKRIVKILIIIIFCFIMLIKVIPMFLLKWMDREEAEIVIAKQKYTIENKQAKKQYNIIGLIDFFTNDQKNLIDKESYHIIFENDLPYTNQQNYIININLTNLESNSQYIVKLNDQMQTLNEGDNQIISNLKEGKNNLTIYLMKNNNIFYSLEKEIYYIEKYHKQFLDEFNENAVSTHFDYKLDDVRSIQLLDSLGIHTLRDDISWKDIENEQGEYNFSKYDEWIGELYHSGFELIAIINNPGDLLGADKIISNDEELNKLVRFCVEFAKRYPQITQYEILNEPNLNYIMPDTVNYYTKAIRIIEEELKKINSNIKILAGSTAAVVYDEDEKLSSVTFVKSILDNTKGKVENISLHQYDETKNANWVRRMLSQHVELLNKKGGFNNIFITEYGASTYKNGYSELEQSSRIIKHAMLFKENNVKKSVIYNSRNIGNVITSREHNFGIINYDYTPKSTYYILKNYYEKTNGSEYIGTVNLNEGIEADVFDKDGKPKIILWTNDGDTVINIAYKNFIAEDLYGEHILNTDGTLTITTSPIYLDNLSTNYFYQAISTTASQKYEEFLTSFEPELTQIPELNQSIITLKTTIESLKDKTDLDENLAKELMAKHYNLGNELISYCRSGKLTVEYVKLSSMLDKLNDIGNSYEDLVTVSAKTRNLSLDQTNQAIQKVEQQIEQNQDLDIIYPTKILEFSQDYYEKANYINNLEEENEIKTGLIVSKNLHAKYLASWAEQFTNLYLDEYIEANPLTLSYSQTNLTNQDVTVTLSAPYDFQVTNNHQAKTYTFTQNGSFTFHYSIRGQAKEITATVTNIDKTPPTITGVEEGKLYFDEAKPIVQDENLQEVKLIVNDQVFESYETNTTIKVEGIYQLIATDKAGNQTKVSFEIIETPDLNYQIKEDKILNIKNNTTKSIFDQTIRINTSYQIKRQNKVLTNADKIATGDILETSGGQTYALIVAGDINGDGEVGTIDLVKMRKYLLGAIELNDIEKLAADANVDGKAVGIQDLVRLRILILSKDN